MTVHYVTFLWGSKWHPRYADKLFASLRRNTTLEHRCVLISDRPVATSADDNFVIPRGYEDMMSRLGCLVRVVAFSRDFQAEMEVRQGDRIAVVDVDAVVTGSMDRAVDRHDELAILQGFNSTNPCPYNGSFWTFPALERHDVHDDCSVDSYHKLRVPFHAIPDDQGWLQYKFPEAVALTPAEGFYCFKKRTWPGGLELPEGARLVAFPGRDPAWYADKAPWIKEHWC